jgi:hypothetical protein
MPCRPQPRGGRTPIGAGQRLVKSHNDATSSGRTTRLWRRRGRRIGAAASRARLPHARPSPPPRHRRARHACTGATRHAEAAFFGVRRRTRGMMCASHCARSAAAIGRQKAVRVHTALPRTVRGMRRTLRLWARSSRRTASLASRAPSHTSGAWLQAEQLRQAKAEVRPPPSARSFQCSESCYVGCGRVLIVRMRAFGSSGSKAFAANANGV